MLSNTQISFSTILAPVSKTSNSSHQTASKELVFDSYPGANDDGALRVLIIFNVSSEKLIIRNAYNLSDRGLDVVKRLKHLKELYISNTPTLTIEGIKNVISAQPSLETLSLLEGFENLTNNQLCNLLRSNSALKTLDLGGNKNLRSEDLPALREYVPNLGSVIVKSQNLLAAATHTPTNHQPVGGQALEHLNRTTQAQTPNVLPEEAAVSQHPALTEQQEAFHSPEVVSTQETLPQIETHEPTDASLNNLPVEESSIASSVNQQSEENTLADTQRVEKIQPNEAPSSTEPAPKIEKTIEELLPIEKVVEDSAPGSTV